MLAKLMSAEISGVRLIHGQRDLESLGNRFRLTAVEGNPPPGKLVDQADAQRVRAGREVVWNREQIAERHDLFRAPGAHAKDSVQGPIRPWKRQSRCG